MTLRNFRLEIDPDGIAVVTWDMPGRTMNVLDVPVIEDLTAILDRITVDPTVIGVVLCSGKSAFSAGADLVLVDEVMRSFDDRVRRHGHETAAARFFKEVSTLSRLFRRIETCGKPWVAALDGSALGGGFELTLACHHRIAAHHAKTRVGVPEATIGLFPGGGGTQRIARLAPLADALAVMVAGEHLKLERAQTLRLIDAIVPAADLIPAAKAWIRNGGSAVAPWDRPGFAPPGDPVWSPAWTATFAAAVARQRRDGGDNYPAPRAILQAVYEGLQLPMDQALTVEARFFAYVLRTPEAKAMVRTRFNSIQELSKGARRPAGEPARAIKRIGVLGAGFMGAGVATVAAQAGLDVVLIDRDQVAAEAGKAHVAAEADKAIARKTASAHDRDRWLAHVTPTTDYAALAGCDLVVEAVFEDRAVKAEVFARAEAVLGDDAVLASNTSTLPIGSLAAFCQRPERFVGIHFFSPVERMALVEIIRGPATGTAALAAAVDLVRLLRKTPIVVDDGPGFYTTRTVMSYLAEGHLMLLDGVPPAVIENAARQAGMPVGPLALTDEIAIDLTQKIMRAFAAERGADAVDPRQTTLLAAMVETHDRKGRKNRRGFYDYPAGGRKQLWAGLAALAPAPRDPATLDPAMLGKRLLAIQALETVRCVEEKVLTDMREGDVGALLGFGFAPWTGGTLSHVDRMGTAAFAALCRSFEQEHGARFAPGALLLDMAASDDRFYRRFPPPTARKTG